MAEELDALVEDYRRIADSHGEHRVNDLVWLVNELIYEREHPQVDASAARIASLQDNRDAWALMATHAQEQLDKAKAVLTAQRDAYAARVKKRREIADDGLLRQLESDLRIAETMLALVVDRLSLM